MLPKGDMRNPCDDPAGCMSRPGGGGSGLWSAPFILTARCPGTTYGITVPTTSPGELSWAQGRWGALGCQAQLLAIPDWCVWGAWLILGGCQS